MLLLKRRYEARFLLRAKRRVWFLEDVKQGLLDAELLSYLVHVLFLLLMGLKLLPQFEKGKYTGVVAGWLQGLGLEAFRDRYKADLYTLILQRTN